MARRRARCRDARRAREREVLEAQVGEPDRAGSAGPRGDRDLEGAELARRAAARGSPRERDLAAADAERLPVRRQREGVAMPPPDVAVARISELDLELVRRRLAAHAERERPRRRERARKRLARDHEATAAAEVEVEPQRGAAAGPRVPREREPGLAGRDGAPARDVAEVVEELVRHPPHPTSTSSSFRPSRSRSRRRSIAITRPALAVWMRLADEGQRRPVQRERLRPVPERADAVGDLDRPPRQLDARAEPVERARQHRIEAERRAPQAQAEQALAHEAHGDARAARVDAPAALDRDRAGAHLVVARRRRVAIGEVGVGARRVAVGLAQPRVRHDVAQARGVRLAERAEERPRRRRGAPAPPPSAGARACT